MDSNRANFKGTIACPISTCLFYMSCIPPPTPGNTRGGGGIQLDYGFICAVGTSFQISFQYAFLLKTTSIGQKFKMVDLKKSDFDNIFQIFY